MNSDFKFFLDKIEENYYISLKILEILYLFINKHFSAISYLCIIFQLRAGINTQQSYKYTYLLYFEFDRRNVYFFRCHIPYHYQESKVFTFFIQQEMSG